MTSCRVPGSRCRLRFEKPYKNEVPIDNTFKKASWNQHFKRTAALCSRMIAICWLWDPQPPLTRSPTPPLPSPGNTGNTVAISCTWTIAFHSCFRNKYGFMHTNFPTCPVWWISALITKLKISNKLFTLRVQTSSYSPCGHFGCSSLFKTIVKGERNGKFVNPWNRSIFNWVASWIAYGIGCKVGLTPNGSGQQHCVFYKGMQVRELGHAMNCCAVPPH